MSKNKKYRSLEEEKQDMCKRAEALQMGMTAASANNLDNRIFTTNDISSMSPEDYSNYRPAIFQQSSDIGIPTEDELQNNTSVAYNDNGDDAGYYSLLAA